MTSRTIRPHWTVAATGQPRVPFVKVGAYGRLPDRTEKRPTGSFSTEPFPPHPHV